MNILGFQKKIWNFYREHKRDALPWRRNITPYRVLVSEVMLQQTQVDRVVPFFNEWTKTFPTWKALANAPQQSVLRYWKGLGYNSRALRLHALAKEVIKKYKGKLPTSYEELTTLPGIGPYTAAAVSAFAWNMPRSLVETNIRTVFFHYFFPQDRKVNDAEILVLVEKTLPKKLSVREWYYALMDYGSHLKKQGVRLNKKSKHYKRQSVFTGSNREVRGKVLGLLLNSQKMKKDSLVEKLKEPKLRVEKILNDLKKEGFISLTKKTVSLV